MKEYTFQYGSALLSMYAENFEKAFEQLVQWVKHPADWQYVGTMPKITEY